MNTEQIIADMIERIVATAHPQQVILFGSRARGAASPDSDVDLLVVMDDDEVDRKSATIALRVAVADAALPKDIVVTTPGEIATRGQLRSTVLYTALREGRVLYAR
jgi:predicted nucleotidyltransferase